MAKHPAAGDPQKVVALMKAAAGNIVLGNIVYWARHEHTDVIGTRSWVIRVQVMPKEIRTALTELGITEVGQAWNNENIIPAPNVSKLIQDWNEAKSLALTDPRITHDPQAEGFPPCRLLYGDDGAIHVVNHEIMDALTALFPNQPITRRNGKNDAIMIGHCLAVALPIILHGEAGDTIRRYLKPPLASDVAARGHKLG